MGRAIKHIDPQKVYELASQGLSKGMICQGLDVDYKTFDKRAADNSQISEALKKGRDASIQIVEDALFSMAASGKYVAATIFYLKNAKPEQYRDVHDVNHTGSMTVNVAGFAKNERVINGDKG